MLRNITEEKPVYIVITEKVDDAAFNTEIRYKHRQRAHGKYIH
jgi:hypothetical protein